MKSPKPYIFLVLVAAAVLSGCSGKNTPPFLKDLLGPTAKEAVQMAFDPDDADRRREGVTLLSRKSYGLREPYLKGYATLARTDSDARVRSAAVRALGKAGDPKYLPDILNALEDESDEVRWDAAVALGTVTGPQAVAPLRRHATNDTFKDVRIACARALRRYPRQDVLISLRDCLADSDFSVRYEAHQSLVILTGTDRGYDPADWRGITTLAPRRESARERPWWDWAGVSNSGGPQTKQPTSAPGKKNIGGRKSGGR